MKRIKIQIHNNWFMMNCSRLIELKKKLPMTIYIGYILISLNYKKLNVSRTEHDFHKIKYLKFV